MQGKPVALITGASHGLGREIAAVYAHEGIPIILTARGADALRDVAEGLRWLTDVMALPGDITDRSHVELLVRAGLDRFGRIDVLVNNASTVGLSPMPALEDYALDAFAALLELNVIAPLHLAQLVLPQMREREAGVIVNVTSDAGVEAYEGWGGYGVSKAALEHLSRVLAVELKGSGVRLYLVDPGDMNTQMHREAEPGVDLSHLPGPEAIAPVFLQLIKEDAEFARFEAPALLRAGRPI